MRWNISPRHVETVPSTTTGLCITTMWCGWNRTVRIEWYAHTSRENQELCYNEMVLATGLCHCIVWCIPFTLCFLASVYSYGSSLFQDTGCPITTSRKYGTALNYVELYIITTLEEKVRLESLSFIVVFFDYILAWKPGMNAFMHSLISVSLKRFIFSPRPA